MKKSTEELLAILKETTNVNAFLEEQEEQFTACSVAECLDRILSEKSLSKSECIQRSGLDRTYGYQIFSGTRQPSRDKLLALCGGMGLTATETQQLLKQSGYSPLYPRNRRDSVILFALNRHLSLSDANQLLYELELPLLE